MKIPFLLSAILSSFKAVSLPYFSSLFMQMDFAQPLQILGQVFPILGQDFAPSL